MNTAIFLPPGNINSELSYINTLEFNKTNDKLHVIKQNQLAVAIFDIKIHTLKMASLAAK